MVVGGHIPCLDVRLKILCLLESTDRGRGYKALPEYLSLFVMMECVITFYTTLSMGVPCTETCPELSGWSFMKIWSALQLRPFFPIS